MRNALLILAALLAAWVATAAEPATARFNHAVEVTAAYPQTGDDGIDGQVRDWLQDHVSETLADLAGVAVHPEMEQGGDGVAVEYEAAHPSARAVSYVFRTMVFPFRAAHPSSRTDVLSFDLETGRQLLPSDLFAKPDQALSVMAAGARHKLAEHFRARSGDAVPADMAENDDAWFLEGFLPTPDNYAALVLVPEGVRVVFQQYQVLPYAFGMPEALYTLEELAPAGPNLAIWGK